MIPGRKGLAYLRSVDPGIAKHAARPVRLVYSGLGVIAFVLVVATLMFHQHADSRSEAAKLGFGYPLHYVVVDRGWQWGAAPGIRGPFSARFDPWEDQFHVGLAAFVVDWAVLTAALCAPVLLYRRRTAS